MMRLLKRLLKPKTLSIRLGQSRRFGFLKREPHTRIGEPGENSVNFPKKDLHRVPHHWRRFGSRMSPLTGSPRLAANPVNAILNYFYAVLESEVSPRTRRAWARSWALACCTLTRRRAIASPVT